VLNLFCQNKLTQEISYEKKIYKKE